MNKQKPPASCCWLTPVALGAADATTPASSATSGTTAPAVPGRTRDESKSQRPDERLLTDATPSKVTAAALAKHPGVTVLRVKTDSDGVSEARLSLADGSRLILQVGMNFAVTDTQTGGPGGLGDASA